MDWLLLLLRVLLGLPRPNGTEPQPVAVRPDGTTMPLLPGKLPPGKLLPGKLHAGSLPAETWPVGPTIFTRRILGDWRKLFLPLGPCVPMVRLLLSDVGASDGRDSPRADCQERPQDGDTV